MTPEQRRDRMVGYLPPALQNGGKIRLVFETLSRELGQMELGLTRLMRSRWYKLANNSKPGTSTPDLVDGGSELGRLGALYGLEPRRSESARYFRERMASLVELHRTGLSSAPALLRLVSLVYMARQPPELSWEGGDAVGLFEVSQEDGTTRRLRVVLSDKPHTPVRARLLGVGAGQQLLTPNNGLEEAIPEISLQATEADISIPLLHHEEHGLDVIFLGRVRKGQTLTLRDTHAPLLDGAPVNEPVIVAHPTRFSARDDVGPRDRFDAPESRFATFKLNQELPRLLQGNNRWRYETLTRAKLASYLQGNLGKEQLDKALALATELPATPRADLQFDWIEVTPATFTLTIPVDYVPPHLRQQDESNQLSGLPGLVRELSAALNHGRAAGVRWRIELTLPLPSEQVSLRESPAHTELSLSFPPRGDKEGLQLTDALVAFGPSLHLTEQVPSPNDNRLTWAGFFDSTRFDTSRFKP